KPTPSLVIYPRPQLRPASCDHAPSQKTKSLILGDIYAYNSLSRPPVPVFRLCISHPGRRSTSPRPTSQASPPPLRRHPPHPPSPTWRKASSRPSTSPSTNTSTPSAPTPGAPPSAPPSPLPTPLPPRHRPPPVVADLQIGQPHPHPLPLRLTNLNHP